MRRAKIVSTLGPATSEYRDRQGDHRSGRRRRPPQPHHGDYSVHEANYENVRRAAEELGKPVAILVDLQGPKIRLAKFADGPHDLAVGDVFTITTEDVPRLE